MIAITNMGATLKERAYAFGIKPVFLNRKTTNACVASD